jgi:hypothetical protein
MTLRRHCALALFLIVACTGANYQARTPNFIVHAPTQQIADRIGQLAEKFRREKAIEWLGREMTPWPQPCPLHVKVSMNGPSGATSFNFGRDNYGRGMVMGQHMQIQGPLDRLMDSVLPHEITHTVFAYHFKCPVPRWADEGGSVLSEDDIERIRHDKLTRQILNSNHQFRLRQLFALTEYPQGKVMHLYAQGYSVTNYLVEMQGKHAFINFVARGMNEGWDRAASMYGFRTVEDLEENWLKKLRETKGQPHIQLAKNTRQPGTRTGPANPAANNPGTVVRLTVPPVQGYEAPGNPGAPVIRAQGSDGDAAPYYGSAQPTSRPRYLPDYQRPRTAQQPGQPAPVPVELGPPRYNIVPAGNAPAAPGSVSPVGFPQR